MQPAVRGLDYLDTDNPAQVLHRCLALPCLVVESTESNRARVFCCVLNHAVMCKASLFNIVLICTEHWQTLTVCVQESKDGLARVQDFLEQVALWSEPEKAAAEEEQEGSPDVVNVMTLHLSKGLEFAVVFIVGKPIQCPCSAVNVLYASYSFAVIDRLPEAVSARHGNTDTANPVLLQFTC